MNPLEYIRKNVFQMTQVDFAEAVGVSQPVVSTWENSDPASSPLSLGQMARIRAAARRRRLEWDDSWFFEVPKVAA